MDNRVRVRLVIFTYQLLIKFHWLVSEIKERKKLKKIIEKN